MAVTNPEIKGSALTCDEFEELTGIPTITQSSHGLAVGDVVKESSLDTFTKATGDTEANLGVGLGVVINVTDTDTFSLLRRNQAQKFTWTSHGLGSSFGDKLWLSASTAGAWTATEPSTIIGSVYLGYRVDANTLMWEPGAITA